MTPKLLKLAASCIAATALAAGVLFFTSSCSPKKESKPVYTGVTVQQTELSARLGYSLYADKYTSVVYEIVDHDYLLKTYHDIFWARLFSEDITKWDERANCAVFTEEYVAGLQRAYYRDHFQSAAPARRLAVGELWYFPNPNDMSIAHSIVIAVTNRGVIYLEPQSRTAPRVLTLSDAQIASRFLRKI